MKFTIAICTYNGERTLSKALEAVLSLDQYDSLISEVLVIDNASTDNTKEIIDSFVCQNEKIQYVFEPNPGLANARRCAIKGSGDWVIYIDDDNIVCSWWLTGLCDIINNNPRVGVINGAVIAIPDNNISDEEEIRLQLMRRHLACTHIRTIDYPAHINTEPMGAGMCIRMDALRTIEKSGWISLLGRTKSSLASGEDTELCSKVFKQGYGYICSYSIQMEHLIPKSRLSEEYTDKLLRGLITSRYAFISQEKYYVIQRLFRLVKHLGLLIKSKIRCSTTKDPYEYEKNREQAVISLTFLKCVGNDVIIKR